MRASSPVRARTALAAAVATALLGAAAAADGRTLAPEERHGWFDHIARACGPAGDAECACVARGHVDAVAREPRERAREQLRKVEQLYRDGDAASVTDALDELDYQIKEACARHLRPHSAEEIQL